MVLRASNLKDLARRLYRRRKQAVLVPYVSVKLEGWRPREQECHGNVNYWVLSHLSEGRTDCKVVQGWLYVENSMQGCPSFIAHSVVETGEGELIDITPSHGKRSYPFLRHNGRVGEFTRLTAKHKLIYLDYEGGPAFQRRDRRGR